MRQNNRNLVTVPAP